MNLITAIFREKKATILYFQCPNCYKVHRSVLGVLMSEEPAPTCDCKTFSFNENSNICKSCGAELIDGECPRTPE